MAKICHFYHLHPYDIEKLDVVMMQDLLNAIPVIEAEKYLNLLEVSSFPQMKREGQKKTLNRLRKLAYSFKTSNNESAITTKQLFERLGAK